MKNELKNLPDLAKSFKLLKIGIELEKNVTDETVFGMGILEGLKHRDVKGVIRMIESQYRDNPQLVSQIVGYNLMQTILDYCEPDDLTQLDNLYNKDL